MTSRFFLPGILLLTTTCSPPAPAGSWRVRFTHVLSSTSDYQVTAERFRDLMLDRTDGRFQVVIYPSSQLGGERVAFELLQAGAQEMAISGTPVLSSWLPESQLFDLPYLFASRDEGLSALNGPLGDWWRDRLLQRTGVRSLGFLDYGFRHVYNRKHPVNTPADLHDLKLRVLPSPTYLAVYRAFGVQAIPMNYGEVYSALQQGVIDGGEANALGFVSDRLLEVGRHFGFTGITYNPITVLINDRFYHSLPEDVRSAVDRSVRDALAFQRDTARQMELTAIRQMEAAGIHITRPATGAFEQVAVQGAWRELLGRLPAEVWTAPLPERVRALSAGRVAPRD